MAWRIEFERSAERELEAFGSQAIKRILKFLHQRVAPLDDPRSIGEALKGKQLGEFWKYRVGDFRIIADIRDTEIVIVVVCVGNRRDVYRR
jgi:mRNA interferase RelE/StbE